MRAHRAVVSTAAKGSTASEVLVIFLIAPAAKRPTWPSGQVAGRLLRSQILWLITTGL